MKSNTAKSKKLSIVICTTGTRDSLTKCLLSTTSSKIDTVEVIVIVQRDKDDFERIMDIKEFQRKDSKISFIYTSKTGLSKARNIGIEKAKSEYIFFTDDDCILEKSTVKNTLLWINQQKNKQKIMCFGKTLPHEPKKQSSTLECPCCFEKSNTNNHHFMHWLDSGFGNNMLISKDLFREIGGFKEWLGVGSIGKSAEDAEFIIRSKRNKYQISYNAKMLIFHNRWLSKEQMIDQERNYNIGGITAYGYHYFRGCQQCKKAFKIHMSLCWQTVLTEGREIRKIITQKNFINQTSQIFNHIQTGIINFSGIIHGLTLALYFSAVDFNKSTFTKRSG